jgi:hypothetical protein
MATRAAFGPPLSVCHVTAVTAFLAACFYYQPSVLSSHKAHNLAPRTSTGAGLFHASNANRPLGDGFDNLLRQHGLGQVFSKFA